MYLKNPAGRGQPVPANPQPRAGWGPAKRIFIPPVPWFGRHATLRGRGFVTQRSGLPPTAPAKLGAACVCFPSGCRLRLGIALDLEDLDLEDKDRAGRDVLPALPVAVREL